MADYMEAIKNAVIGGKHAEIKALVNQALDAGLDPNTIINDALIAAMDVVGTDFGSGKIFVPEMLVAALTMKSGLAIVKPRLAAGQGQSRGTVIMATVKGDLHDIGKNLVSMMLEGAGFKVLDLGVDLSVEKLIDQVKALQPDILGDKVKVLVGGAPLDRAFAEKIGADGYGANAAEAVELARRFAGVKA
jgi:5-methyltetrahydrofolate--homocysteine methyltransferase